MQMEGDRRVSVSQISEDLLGIDERSERRPRAGIKSESSRRRRVSSLTLAALDVVLIYGAFALAYWLRYAVKLGPSIHDLTPFSGYQSVVLLLLGIMIPALLLKGAYRSRLSTEIADEVVTVISSATISIAAVVVISFMLHQLEYSRAVIGYMWVSLIVLLPLGRAGYRVLQGKLHRKGWAVRRLLVVGASDTGKMVMQSVAGRPDLGYEVVGFVDHQSLRRPQDFGRFRVLGTIDDIPALIEAEQVDEVIVALPASAHEHVWEIVNLCDRAGVGLKLVPDLFEMSLSRVQVDDIAGIPLLDVRELPIKWVSRALKRAIDIGVGTAVLVASFPLIAALAVIVRLDSEGPAFIKQERVGQAGRRFSCLKLRTMRVDADSMLPALQALNEASGPIFKMRSDPRCTRVGRLIRRWSLDELPQIWNVVRGDMSLVGPRPPLQREVDRYEAWQMRRLEAKPGVTGMWQVSGRSNLAFEEMVMMDLMYVDNWSLGLDLKILLRTVTAVVAARGAY